MAELTLLSLGRRVCATSPSVTMGGASSAPAMTRTSGCGTQRPARCCAPSTRGRWEMGRWRGCMHGDRHGAAHLQHGEGGKWGGGGVGKHATVGVGCGLRVCEYGIDVNACTPYLMTCPHSLPGSRSTTVSRCTRTTASRMCSWQAAVTRRSTSSISTLAIPCR